MNINKCVIYNKDEAEEFAQAKGRLRQQQLIFLIWGLLLAPRGVIQGIEECAHGEERLGLPLYLQIGEKL